MKEILEALSKKDTIEFQNKIQNKKVNALEAYFDEEDGRTTVILYRYKHKKVRCFCFNEKDYFEKIRYYQAICDSLIASCRVNNASSLNKITYFNPKQSKRLKSVVIWYNK